MKTVLAFLTATVFTVAMMAFRTNDPKPTAAKIQWLTLEEAIKQNKKEPRKVFVDLYTDWCGWCKVMDKNTFTNAEVIAYVNKKYYAVKHNPEKDGDVQMGSTTFKTMLNGKVTGYPTTVFMDEKMALIQPLAGYLEPRMFHQVVTYFGENNYQKEPFEQYKTASYPKLFTQKAQ
jgi:thioredoxin-related protein